MACEVVSGVSHAKPLVKVVDHPFRYEPAGPPRANRCEEEYQVTISVPRSLPPGGPRTIAPPPPPYPWRYTRWNVKVLGLISGSFFSQPYV